MTIELPKVASAAAIDLDITEHGLELTVRRAGQLPHCKIVTLSHVPGVFYLKHGFPFPVRDGEAAAKFNKDQHTLTLTLPVVPPTRITVASLPRNSVPQDEQSFAAELKAEADAKAAAEAKAAADAKAAAEAKAAADAKAAIAAKSVADAKAAANAMIANEAKYAATKAASAASTSSTSLPHAAPAPPSTSDVELPDVEWRQNPTAGAGAPLFSRMHAHV